ncbi:alpha/beta fold hydrolase [soil metagenome]
MKHLVIDGAKWAYDAQGSGPSLLLIHGFPLDRRLWSSLAAELAPRFRVVTVDLPGFGQSTLGSGFTMESLGDGLAEFAKSLSLGKFFVAGLSMGGYASLALASQHMADLAGLALVDTKATADTPEQKAGRNKMIELVRTKGSKAVAAEMLGKMLSVDTIRQSPQTVRDLQDMMEAVAPKTIETALAAMRERADYVNLLPKLTVPLKIIVGQDDVIAPPALAETIRAAAPGSQLFVIPGAGHLAPLEQPKLVADALRTFLA